MSASGVENLLNKAIELHRKADLSGAIRAYEKFLAKVPQHPGAMNLLGLAYFQSDNAVRALPMLERALALRADLPGASYNLGTVLHVLGRHDEAVPHLEKALALNPHDAEAHNNLATVLKAVGRNALAAVHLERAIALQPGYLAAHLNLGQLLLEESQFERAASVYRTIIASEPRALNARFGLGAALNGLGRYDEAITVCENAVALAPDNAEAHYNLGKALESAKRFEAAVVSYQAALRYKPDYAEAHVYLGHCYGVINRYEDAHRELLLALSLKLAPELAAKTRLAVAGSLEALGRYDEADQQFDQVIAEHPDDASGAEAKKGKAFMYLSLGKFAEGWPLYRYRNVVEGENIREQIKSPWAGETIAGPLWVWGEHGLGDQILNAGMIGELQARVPSIIMEVERRLVDLFARSFPSVRVVAYGSDLSRVGIAAQVPITRLGQFLRPHWDSFPKRERGYLTADPERTAALRARLTIGGEKLVGLSWRSVSPIMGRNKSARLIDLSGILRLPGARFIDLQYGETGEERAAVERETGVAVRRIDDIDNTNDIDGLAALTSACDAVVTVSNTTAHLAGALGRPTWVFVPFGFAGIWYWFKEKKQSPWYANVYVRYQAMDQPWDRLMSAASAEISRFLETR